MSHHDLESDPPPVPQVQLAAPPKIVRCPYCNGRGGGPNNCGEYSHCRACAARGYINVEDAGLWLGYLTPRYSPIRSA
jgi:hypothetical protein